MTISTVKVLIVDDEPPIRKLLRVGLGTEGYATTEAANARDAIERVKEDKPISSCSTSGCPTCPAMIFSENGATSFWICRS
jgi:two-component system KDP operon response regulator KdpE